jgi:dTDP-glucose 4,6-dehydratase
MRVLLTGGAGFIGSAVVRRLVRAGHQVLNIDKLTYAGNLLTVAEVAGHAGYHFSQIDIADYGALAAAFSEFSPQRVIHLAAETHVDRSIDSAFPFIQTNIVGVHALLEVGLNHWMKLSGTDKSEFRMVMVSTDEVYGSLGPEGSFTEQTPLAPRSPYAASKAAADLLTLAWSSTHGLPVILTNCSNNFGPWQHPEKLIPTIIRNALSGQDIPIYGDGRNVRDWLFVEDHVDALLSTAERGVPGERYNFGGDTEITNFEMAQAVCALLDKNVPKGDGTCYGQQCRFVADRPGHDYRYAIDSSKARHHLGWTPNFDFQRALEVSVGWYLDNPQWFDRPSAELTRLGLKRGADMLAGVRS